MNERDDPFARLGVPRRFRLRNEVIRERQRQALARCHPDRAADPMARALAVRESAAISAAAQCLLDPRSRAEALLRGAGVEPAPAPPGLLMEMLEWRERVEASMHAEAPGAMELERAEISERVARIRQQLGDAIDGAEDPRTGQGGAEGASDKTRGAPALARASDAALIADPTRAGALLTELRLVERLLEQAGDL